jgi:hypothetical protein
MMSNGPALCCHLQDSLVATSYKSIATGIWPVFYASLSFSLAFSRDSGTLSGSVIEGDTFLKLNIMALLAIFAVLLCAPAIRSAADPPAQSQATNPLNLSDAQKAKMQARYQKMQADMQALQGNKAMTMPQKRATFQQMQKAYAADMMAVLTPSQRVQAKSLELAQAKARAIAMARVAKIRSIQTQLQSTLSAAQKTKIQSIMTTNNQTMQSIMGNKMASDAQKRTDLLTAQHQAEHAVMAVLTPTQQTEFQEIENLMPSMAPPPGSQ